MDLSARGTFELVYLHSIPIHQMPRVVLSSGSVCRDTLTQQIVAFHDSAPKPWKPGSDEYIDSDEVSTRENSTPEAHSTSSRHSCHQGQGDFGEHCTDDDDQADITLECDACEVMGELDGLPGKGLDLIARSLIQDMPDDVLVEFVQAAGQPLESGAQDLTAGPLEHRVGHLDSDAGHNDGSCLSGEASDVDDASLSDDCVGDEVDPITMPASTVPQRIRLMLTTSEHGLDSSAHGNSVCAIDSGIPVESEPINRSTMTPFVTLTAKLDDRDNCANSAIPAEREVASQCTMTSTLVLTVSSDGSSDTGNEAIFAESEATDETAAFFETEEADRSAIPPTMTTPSAADTSAMREDSVLSTQSCKSVARESTDLERLLTPSREKVRAPKSLTKVVAPNRRQSKLSPVDEEILDTLDDFKPLQRLCGEEL